MAALRQALLAGLIEDYPSKCLCIFEALLPGLPTRHLRCKRSYLLAELAGVSRKRLFLELDCLADVDPNISVRASA